MFTKQNVRNYVHVYKPLKANKKKSRADDLFEVDIPTTGDISGIELRLSRAHILDNRTPNIGPFPGYAKIYFLTLVVSDIHNQAVFVDVKGFPKVDDKEDLPIDNTLYYWKKTSASKNPPSQLHVFTSIIKANNHYAMQEKFFRRLKMMKDINLLLKQ